ncbi:MAG TPA: DUF4142 domain-containing protein [Vicinamibacterales bacterium]
MSASRTIIAMAVAFGFSTALTAQQQQPPPQTPRPPAQHPAPATHEAAESASGDRAFVLKMANGGMAEVELGKLAVKNGGSQDVKSFGQRMVDDHSKAGDELKSIADKKNIPWPTKLDAKDQALHDKLAALNGQAFDRAYLGAMIPGHKKVASALRTESKSGKDPDVKQWAAKTLPTVEEHLKLAEDANHMKSTAESRGSAKARR